MSALGLFFDAASVAAVPLYGVPASLPPPPPSLPKGNLLGLWEPAPYPSTPQGPAGFPVGSPWSEHHNHGIGRRSLRRVRKLDRSYRGVPANAAPAAAAATAPAAHAPPTAAPAAGPSGGNGQNAQLSNNVLPQPAANAATGGAGSAQTN